MTTTSTYDAHADWYEDYVTGAAAEYTTRRQALLRRLLGAGRGVCLDLSRRTDPSPSIISATCWYRSPMTRRRLWRSLLTATAYVAVTLAVLLLAGALMRPRSTLFQGRGEGVVLLLGAALLLLGAGRLVHRAVRSLTQRRGQG